MNGVLIIPSEKCVLCGETQKPVWAKEKTELIRGFGGVLEIKRDLTERKSTKGQKCRSDPVHTTILWTKKRTLIFPKVFTPSSLEKELRGMNLGPQFC